jgi:hypothetical protein
MLIRVAGKEREEIATTSNAKPKERQNVELK